MLAGSLEDPSAGALWGSFESNEARGIEEEFSGEGEWLLTVVLFLASSRAMFGIRFSSVLITFRGRAFTVDSNSSDFLLAESSVRLGSILPDSVESETGSKDICFSSSVIIFDSRIDDKNACNPLFLGGRFIFS